MRFSIVVFNGQTQILEGLTSCRLRQHFTCAPETGTHHQSESGDAMYHAAAPEVGEADQNAVSLNHRSRAQQLDKSGSCKIGF
jgi:hypothetical protein